MPGWHLPGGGVETGETALEALERELHEEACIAIGRAAGPLGVFFNRKISRRDHVLVYVIRRFTVLEVKQPDREIAEAGFFPLDRPAGGNDGRPPAAGSPRSSKGRTPSPELVRGVCAAFPTLLWPRFIEETPSPMTIIRILRRRHG